MLLWILNDLHCTLMYPLVVSSRELRTIHNLNSNACTRYFRTECVHGVLIIPTNVPSCDSWKSAQSRHHPIHLFRGVNCHQGRVISVTEITCRCRVHRRRVEAVATPVPERHGRDASLWSASRFSNTLRQTLYRRRKQESLRQASGDPWLSNQRQLLRLACLYMSPCTSYTIGIWQGTSCK